MFRSKFLRISLEGGRIVQQLKRREYNKDEANIPNNMNSTNRKADKFATIFTKAIYTLAYRSEKKKYSISL